MESYDKLLERAYAGLPEKAKTHDNRFEIPKLDIIQQSSKTIIRNFIQACEKIRREPQYVAKYLSRELAVPTTISNNTLILFGKFNDKIINSKFERYVKKYVICPECGKPDTKIIEQDKVKILVCEACGARTPIR
ncbi:translation initiation factor IF-2 subunit beta [Candidatus Micrarchaeota archaeon]|nr:translation initiation factor IF-2 subunit beta [Candidatus Micrarchaeota archaeon]